MRGISFRGLTENGEWHKGLVAESAGFTGQVEAGVYISNMAGYPHAFKVRLETIGEFTGLLDKTGKKIYEGDIVRHSGRCESEVVFNEDNCAFQLCNKSLGYMYMDKSFSAKHFEIIGNIYEKPELIKEAK